MTVDVPIVNMDHLLLILKLPVPIGEASRLCLGGQIFSTSIP